MTQSGHITVLGAGITAHAAALLLAEQGFSVSLPAPQAQPHTRDIRAYAINHTSRDTLKACGVWPQDDQAAWLTPMTHMRVFGDASGALQFDAPPQQAQPLAWMVDVPVLEDHLAEAVTRHARVQFKDHASPSAQTPPSALTIICEGKSGIARTALGIDMVSKHYPHRALALRMRAEHSHGGGAHQWFNGTHILALLPMGGADGHDLAVVWSLPDAAHQTWLDMETTAQTAALEDQLTQASQGALGHLSLTSGPVAFPLSVGLTTQWVAQQTALAGDAAHTIHPLAGQGLNLGLADVQTLSDCVAARARGESPGASRVLQRYQRRRRAATEPMQWVTHGLFHLFNNPLGRNPAASWLRNAGMSGFNAMGPLKSWVQRVGMGN